MDQQVPTAALGQKPQREVYSIGLEDAYRRGVMIPAQQYAKTAPVVQVQQTPQILPQTIQDGGAGQAVNFRDRYGDPISMSTLQLLPKMSRVVSCDLYDIHHARQNNVPLDRAVRVPMILKDLACWDSVELPIGYTGNSVVPIYDQVVKALWQKRLPGNSQNLPLQKGRAMAIGRVFLRVYPNNNRADVEGLLSRGVFQWSHDDNNNLGMTKALWDLPSLGPEVRLDAAALAPWISPRAEQELGWGDLYVGCFLGDLVEVQASINFGVLPAALVAATRIWICFAGYELIKTDLSIGYLCGASA